MQETWLKKEDSQDLVIYILGWGTSPNAVFPIQHPDGFDVLCCCDYADWYELEPERFAQYRRIYLFAWSFGVWIAEQCCSKLPLYKAIALNGTPYPVSKDYGMRLRVVKRTVQGLARVGIGAFQEKAFGPNADLPEGPYPERPIQALVDELDILAEASENNCPENIQWDAAYIADKDEIFRPANMWAYWQTRDLGKGFDSYHYPFTNHSLILNHLVDGN